MEQISAGMARVVKGKSLSPGIAVGPAYIYQDFLQRDHEYYEIDSADVDDEFSRIRMAFASVSDDLDALSFRVLEELDQDSARIFIAHKAFLDDGNAGNTCASESSRVAAIANRRVDEAV